MLVSFASYVPYTSPSDCLKTQFYNMHIRIPVFENFEILNSQIVNLSFETDCRCIQLNERMLKEIKSFMTATNKKGVIIDKDMLDSLNSEISNVIPEWFKELITKTPIANLEIGWQAFDPDDKFDGVEWITILDINLLKEINLNSYPGNLIYPLGYFTFGYGSSWAGNCFIIKTDEGFDPPVYEIWHDVAHDIESMKIEIEENNALRKVSNSFSEFFRNGAEILNKEIGYNNV